MVGKKVDGGALVGTVIRALQTKQDIAYREHAELLYLIHELSRLISTGFDKALAHHHLTHAQWWALVHIFRHEGATQSELAVILQMGRAATGKLLERLETKRWIERRGVAGDGRLRRVYLRKEAIPVFMVMTSEGRGLFRTCLKGIGALEEKAMKLGLRKIAANAERLAEAGE